MEDLPSMSVAIGISIGVYSAVSCGGILDGAARVFAVLGQSMPPFWLGLMLILLFGVGLGVLPAGGYGGPQHLILPAFTLGYFTSAAIMRLTRSSMLEVLGSDYIKFARLKGLHEQIVFWKHDLKNALLDHLRRHALRAIPGGRGHRNRVRLAWIGATHLGNPHHP
jgi:peptide/nickel transport system permease protein